MESPIVLVNRAPVLTLWAAVVAERLGFAHDEALTLGRAVAGLNAYSKGKALGIFKPAPERVRGDRQRRPARAQRVELLHRVVEVVRTPEGLRAVSKGAPVNPATVMAYLQSKFGDALSPVREAMTELARTYAADELAQRAYSLYEEFRPQVQSGESGWGARGALELSRIRALASRN